MVLLWRFLSHFSGFKFFKTDLNGSNDSNGIFISFCSCVVPRTSPLLTAQFPVLFANFLLSGMCLFILLLKWRHVTGKLASRDVTWISYKTKIQLRLNFETGFFRYGFWNRLETATSPIIWHNTQNNLHSMKSRFTAFRPWNYGIQFWWTSWSTYGLNIKPMRHSFFRIRWLPQQHHHHELSFMLDPLRGLFTEEICTRNFAEVQNHPDSNASPSRNAKTRTHMSVSFQNILRQNSYDSPPSLQAFHQYLPASLSSISPCITKASSLKNTLSW